MIFRNLKASNEMDVMEPLTSKFSATNTYSIGSGNRESGKASEVGSALKFDIAPIIRILSLQCI